MKNKYFIFKFSGYLFALIILSVYSYSQCTNTTAYGTITAPTSGSTETISTIQYATEYATINSVAASTTYISESSISTDYITIRQGSSDGPVIDYGTTPLTWTSTVAGTYYMHINTNSSCGTSSSSRTTTVQHVGSPSSDCTYSISLLDTYGDGWDGASITVNVDGVNIITSQTLSSGYGPVNYDFNVSPGQTITINFSSGSYPSECYYNVYNNSNAGGTIIYSSTSGSAPPSSQTITNSCGGTAPPAPNTCLGASPFCTSDAYTFPASTNVASMGSVGCLYTTPNPAWYWMEIGDPGNIDIYMSSGGDVDFIAWGPFTSLQDACASDLMSNPGVDCSYSTAAQETANITNAQNGQVYVLLITNYANMVTNISFSQTAGGGSTNCGIIAPPISNNGPLCASQTLNLTVSNPSSGATYNWTGPNNWTSTQMNPSIPNATTSNSGTYTLTISSGGQTSPPVSTEVIINSLPIVSVTATNSTICIGSQSSLTATGASTYSWSGGLINGSTDNPINVNPTNTTTYTVTGTSSGCSNTADITVNVNPIPNVSINATPTSICVGNSSTISASGADSYSWDNSLGLNSTVSVSPTSTTTYTVTGTSLGCSATASLTLTVSPNPIANAFVESIPTCYNMQNGVISVSVTEGTPYYNYLWNTTDTIQSPNTCGSGNYSVTVIDANLCSATSTVELTEPIVLTSSITEITPQQCTDFGSVTIDANGGTTPYTYIWPEDVGGVIDNSASNIIAGLYYVTITDYNSCSTVQEISITGGGPVSAISTVTASPLCFGDNNGNIMVNISSGTPNYDINWEQGNVSISNNSHTITDLPAGDYTITITDSNNCQEINSITITQPTQLIASSSATQILCNGGLSTITVTATGGTQNYSGIGNFTITAGTYTHAVIDQNGCTEVTSTIVTEPTPLTISVNQTTSIDCFGNSANVLVSVSGGIMPYQGIGELSLTSGVHNIIVSDNNGCTSQSSISIYEPAELNANYEVYNPSCRGNNDGYIQLQAIGGTGQYYYICNQNMIFDPIISNLEEGEYVIEVIDENNCSIVLDGISLNDVQEDCISIPDVFTPNADGINDTWLIEHIEYFPNAIINVFNRWGQQVYSAYSNDNPWDGKFNGSLLPSGTFIYTINLYNGKKTLSGTVTIVH